MLQDDGQIESDYQMDWDNKHEIASQNAPASYDINNIPKVSPTKAYANKSAPLKTNTFEKKGFITNYLTTLDTKQLVDNTLTGFLINLIRRKGNMMSLADLIAFTETRFDTLRKPNGKPYKCKSQKKSIVCALSSNGIFSQVSKSQLE